MIRRKAGDSFHSSPRGSRENGPTLPEAAPYRSSRRYETPRFTVVARLNARRRAGSATRRSCRC